MLDGIGKVRGTSERLRIKRRGEKALWTSTKTLLMGTIYTVLSSSDGRTGHRKVRDRREGEKKDPGLNKEFWFLDIGDRRRSAGDFDELRTLNGATNG